MSVGIVPARPGPGRGARGHAASPGRVGRSRLTASWAVLPCLGVGRRPTSSSWPAAVPPCHWSLALGEVMWAILPKPPSAAMNQIASFVWKVLHPYKHGFAEKRTRNLASPQKIFTWGLGSHSPPRLGVLTKGSGSETKLFLPRRQGLQIRYQIAIILVGIVAWRDAPKARQKRPGISCWKPINRRTLFRAGFARPLEDGRM